MEELERKTEEKMIQKKELRRKIKEKISFTTEKYRKEADRKITESVLELKEYQSAYTRSTHYKSCLRVHMESLNQKKTRKD